MSGGPASTPSNISNGSLTLAGAELVIQAASRFAAGKAGTGSIAVVDSGGHLLMLHRLDGTFPASARISEGKARTAAIFRKPTRDFEQAINGGRTAMAAMDGWTPLQGGVPVIVDGICVGAVGVSGAASAAQDDEIASAGAAAITH
ncbi:MAG: heme-binding protein [Planctomycetota bacterium]|nr:heme-binding protein [Planctomycetota bacterium]